MGAKLSLQHETLPTTLMLNEPQSAVLWNQQVQNRWHTPPYEELPNQLQNFSISSLSVMTNYKYIFKSISSYLNDCNVVG